MRQFKGEIIFALNLPCLKMKGISGVAAEKPKMPRKKRKKEKGRR